MQGGSQKNDKTRAHQVNDALNKQRRRKAPAEAAGRRRGGGGEDFPGRGEGNRARRSGSALPSE